MARIDVSEAYFNGNESMDEIAVDAEAIEGRVAIHTVQSNGETGFPAASIYLSLVDAAMLSERLAAASRRAAAEPTYAP